jgi:hypothetical protein
MQWFPTQFDDFGAAFLKTRATKKVNNSTVESRFQKRGPRMPEEHSFVLRWHSAIISLNSLPIIDHRSDVGPDYHIRWPISMRFCRQKRARLMRVGRKTQTKKHTSKFQPNYLGAEGGV